MKRKISRSTIADRPTSRQPAVAATVGVQFTSSGASFTNSGTITANGGDGGIAAHDDLDGIGSKGGVGVRGSGLSITNSGTINCTTLGETVGEKA